MGGRMVAVLLAPVAVLALAGTVTAANDPVTVTITEASSAAGQACVDVAVKDSVTGQPVAADFVLLINGTLNAVGETPVSSNASGTGYVCFNRPSASNPNVTVQSASVTLQTGNAVTVHAGPDYQTTGTSNTVSVTFLGKTVQTTTATPGTTTADGMSVTPTVTPASPVTGQQATISVALSYSGTLPAGYLSLELDFSGVPVTVGAADGGTCSGTSTVTCSLSDLAKGASETVNLHVTPGSPGQIAVAFDVRFKTTATNPSTQQPVLFPGDVLGSFNVTAVAPQADLSIALKGAKARVGSPVNVTAVVRNAGPQAAPGATLSFVVPRGMRLVRLAGTGLACHVASAACTISSLQSAGGETVVLVVKPSKPGTAHISAKVALTGATDPVVANNSATLTLTVLAAKH